MNLFLILHCRDEFCIRIHILSVSTIQIASCLNSFRLVGCVSYDQIFVVVIFSM